MPNSNAPFVSVIVPVYNGEMTIENCIKSLLDQNYPKERYEIIIVDNNSTDKTAEIIKKYPVQYALEDSVLSSYAARNKGISLSKGDILAFTDADCVAAQDWIEKGVKRLLSVPNCGLAAGAIQFSFVNPDNPRAVELYDSVRYLQQTDFINIYRFGATANLFTFRKVMDHVGNFDSALKSSGDREWGERVFSHGYKQLYAEDVRVAHPAKHTIGELYKRTIRIIEGAHALRVKNNYTFKSFIDEMSEIPIGFFVTTSGIWNEKRIKGWGQKLKALLINFLIYFIIICETARLIIRGSFKSCKKQERGK